MHASEVFDISGYFRLGNYIPRRRRNAGRQKDGVVKKLIKQAMLFRSYGTYGKTHRFTLFDPRCAGQEKTLSAQGITDRLISRYIIA